MNLRQLEHFVAVMDHGSLSAAARAVNLSQPALSRSISTLEGQLGVPLFDRQGRPRPTPYAMVYVERARGILFSEREAARSLALMRSGELGPLAFGMTSASAESLLPVMLARLLSLGPALRLRTTVGNSMQLMDKMLAEDLDFFIGDINVIERHREVSVEPVHRAGFGWFVRGGHPLAGQKQMTLDDTRRFPLAAGYGHQTLSRQIERLYDLRAPFESQLSVITDDVGTIRKLIVSSDVVVPGIAFPLIELLRRGEVVMLDVKPKLDVSIDLGIIHLTGRTLAPAATHAFEMIRNFFKDLARDDPSPGGRRRPRVALPCPRE